MIFWTRPHPKAANPTAPTCARPSYWNNTDDILYVWVALKAAAAGVSKIGIASAAGSITGKIVRSGTTVKNYDFSNTVIPLTIITTISSPLSENLFLSFTIFLFIPLFIPLHDILIAEVYIYAHLLL